MRESDAWRPTFLRSVWRPSSDIASTNDPATLDGYAMVDVEERHDHIVSIFV